MTERSRSATRAPANHPLQAATGSSYNPDANWPHPHARELATTVKVDAGGAWHGLFASDSTGHADHAENVIP